MVAPLATHTLADLIAYTQRQFGDESGVQITVADITRWCNQGQNEIVNKNPFLEKAAVVLINADTYPPGVGSFSNTPAPADCIKIDGVLWQSLKIDPTLGIPQTVEQRSLENIEFNELMNDTEFKLIQKGKPRWYSERGNTISIWPTIGITTTSIDTISVLYRCTPTKANVPSDLLGIPDRYYDRLCEYVLSQCYILDQDLDSASQMRNQFESKLQEATNAESERGGAFQVITEYGWD